MSKCHWGPQARLLYLARVEHHPCRCHVCRYSELSWDVVEPVTYFTSQLWAILGYCYFLASPPVFSRLKSSCALTAARGDVLCMHEVRASLAASSG